MKIKQMSEASDFYSGEVSRLAQWYSFAIFVFTILSQNEQIHEILSKSNIKTSLYISVIFFVLHFLQYFYYSLIWWYFNAFYFKKYTEVFPEGANVNELNADVPDTIHYLGNFFYYTKIAACVVSVVYFLKTI